MPRSVLLTVLLSFCLVLSACKNDDSRSVPLSVAQQQQASTSSGSSASGSTAGGQTGGSTGSSTGSATPAANDTTAPDIQVAAPARGEFLQGLTTQVTGTVTDASPIVRVELNGRPIQLGAQGGFQETVNLTPGTNLFELVAVDAAGNHGQVAFGCMAGSYVPSSDPVPDAFGARVTEGTVQDLLNQFQHKIIKKSDLVKQVMAQNPVFRDRVQVGGLTVASAEVSVTHLDFDPLAITVDMVPGGMDVRIDVPNFRVTVDARDWGGVPWKATGTVSADPIEVQVAATISVPSPGQIDVQIQNVSVTFHNFNWGIQNFPSLLTNLAKKAVKKKIETEIEDQLKNQLPAQIQKALSGVSTSFSTKFLNRTFDFDFIATAIDMQSDAAVLTLDADVRPGQGAIAIQNPGSVATPNPFPTHGTQTDFCVFATDDILNRLLHAAWRGGLLDWTIDQTTLQNQGINFPLQLNGSLISYFFPRVANALPQGSLSLPLQVRLSGQLPPTVRVTGTPDLFELSLGELLLEINLKGTAQASPTSVLRIAVNLKQGATLTPQNGRLVLSSAGPATFKADLLHSVVPVDAHRIETFLQFVVPPAIRIGLSQVPPLAIPSGKGISITNLGIGKVGTDTLQVKGDVK